MTGDRLLSELSNPPLLICMWIHLDRPPPRLGSRADPLISTRTIALTPSLLSTLAIPSRPGEDSDQAPAMAAGQSFLALEPLLSLTLCWCPSKVSVFT